MALSDHMDSSPVQWGQPTTTQLHLHVDPHPAHILPAQMGDDYSVSGWDKHSSAPRVSVTAHPTPQQSNPSPSTAAKDLTQRCRG